MNFEKRMKKHIDQTLNEVVPNPYPVEKKQSFPRLFKVLIPAATLALAASVTAVILVPNIIKKANQAHNQDPQPKSQDPQPKSYIILPNEGYLNVAAPKASYYPSFEKKFVERTGYKAIKTFDSFFNNQKNTDFVVSPFSYLLCMGGLVAVSDGYTLDEFGFEDPSKDVKTMLETTNGAWTQNGKLYAKIDSGILHQQVGPTFEFLDSKRQEVANDYIGTAVANLGNYLQQAEEYFKEAVGLSIPVPDPKLVNDGIITYGAVKFRDCAGFETEVRDFTLGKKTIKVNTGKYYEERKPCSSWYYENGQYSVSKFRINTTDLLIVLPKEGVSLESISVSEAYNNYINNGSGVYMYGYIPYFHNQTLNLDITKNVTDHMNWNEVLYTKLMEYGVPAKALDIKVVQSSDFKLDETGVSGESVTAHGGSASGGTPKNPLFVDVNRPFYAISTMNDFPMFVNKVTNPSLN